MPPPCRSCWPRDPTCTSSTCNVDSRLRRLREGDFDAIVLAAAGLQRLALPCDSLLACGEMVPAPGQGALMLGVEAEHDRALELVSAVNDATAERALQAERTVAAALGATCDTPLGAYARITGGGIKLDVFAGAADGSFHARVTGSGPAGASRALAKAAARQLRRDHRVALEAAA